MHEPSEVWLESDQIGDLPDTRIRWLPLGTIMRTRH